MRVSRLFFYCFLLGWCVAFYFLFKSNSTSFSIAESFLLLSAIAINELKISKFLKLNQSIILLTLILLISIGIGVTNLSFGNPYSIFNFTFLEGLSFAFLICIVFKNLGKEELDYKLLYFNSLMYLIVMNSFYVIMNFGTIGESDNIRHASNSLNLYDIFFGSGNFKMIKFLGYYDFYQPLSYFVTLPFLAFFGKSYASATLSITFFWLPIGYYFLSKFLIKFQKVKPLYSIGICFIFFGSCFSASMMKQFMLDFQCMVVVIVYLYFIFKSNFLCDKKYSIISGLIFGLGILTKSNFLLISLIVPVVAILRVLYKAYNTPQKATIYFENIVIHLAFIFLSGGFWYFLNFEFYNYTLPSVTSEAGRVEGDPYPFSISSFLWYPIKLPDYFGWITFTSIVLGLAFNFRFFKKATFFSIISVLSLILTFSVGFITWNKDMRTIFPSLVFLLPIFIAVVRFSNLKFVITFFILNILSIICTQISYVFNDPFRIEGVLIPFPYTIESKFSTPDNVDYRELNYIHKNALSVLRPGEKIENQYPVTTNVYTDVFYQKYLNKPEFHIDREFDTSFVLKSTTWPDYYLLTVKTKGSPDIEIVYYDLNVSIGGDFVINVVDCYEDKKEVTEIRLSQGQKFIYSPKSTTSKVLFQTFIHHAHSTVAIEQLYYKLAGKGEILRFNIPLMNYQLSTPTNELYIN